MMNGACHSSLIVENDDGDRKLSPACRRFADPPRLLGSHLPGATMKCRWISLLALAVFTSNATADDADKFTFFESKIRPVLVENCLKCHGETKANGKLRLDSKM